eukprot:scaffold10807_cov79-Phaeocystis_antarctica.AAC.9
MYRPCAMIEPLSRAPLIASKPPSRALVRVPVGGDQERVEIYLIAHPNDDQTEARRLLTEQFATFDAGKARCFLANDREHLLAVIEAGFGDFDDFNRVARNILASRTRRAAACSRGVRLAGTCCERLHSLRK